MLRSQKNHTVYVSVDGKLMAQSQALPKGEYKQDANGPTRSDGSVHAYAPVDETVPEMTRLIDQLRSEEFEAAHPVAQAAYAQYAFVCIHPFADGNGRVARALASVYLYRSPGVPLVIYQDQRANYIDALEAADRGQFHTLMRFIAERVVDSVNVIDAELTAPVAGNAADELAGLLSESRTPQGVRDAAERLQQILAEELQSRMEMQSERFGLPFEVRMPLIGGIVSMPDDYQSVDDDMAVTLVGTVPSPREIHVAWPVQLCSRSSDDADFDLLAVTSSGRSFGVYTRELLPTVSESLRQRVGFFADAAVEEFLAQVADALRSAER